MKIKLIMPLVALGIFHSLGMAQQFNSDNYLTMPHGTCTFALTTGERNSAFVNSFALFPRWEFFAQAFLFREKKEQEIPQHFSTTVYAKYMFYENNSKTGGGAVFLGFGKAPGYFQKGDYTPLHKSYWTALPVTIPFFDNALSWDIMPGATLDLASGDESKTAWGFTWSTRLAVYKIIPKSAIVGEIYGTDGDLFSKPEYKIGIRWEPNDTIIPAFTFSSALDGSDAAGFEIGVVIFTPQFLKIGKGK